MKQSTVITKIIILLLTVAVAVYLAVYAVQSLTDPFSSVMAYQDTLDEFAEVSGVVVRQEQVLAEGSDIMDLLPDEGERVASGSTVAILYDNSSALERKQQLQILEQKRSQLTYALTSGGSLSDTAKLEQQIVESIISLRAGTVSGDFSSLDSDALSLRTQVLQREFTYSASGDSSAALTETISQLDTQIAQLKNQSESETTRVFAPCSGLFSASVDGLEDILTHTALETMSAGQLNSYIGKSYASTSTPVGKLITGDRWYFATVVDSETVKHIHPGDFLTAAFSRDFTGEIDMRVERVGEDSGSGCILVLSSDRYLNQVTMLRTQTVQLIFTRHTGIRVPKQALHMETFVQTNKDTGEETLFQRIGVYTVVAGRAEFNLVDIVREGSDYYLVSPSQEARTYSIGQQGDYYRLITASEAADLHLLRAGDEIILNAPGLFDGKVVLE